MLCVALLLLLAAQQGYCQLPIRLVNGAFEYMGRVEVLVEGEWGTVCDDRFGLQDGNVICRMLGYPRAVTTRFKAYYGAGTGKIWIDQLECNGDEDSIFECKMNKLGVHDCEHKEDAGVECYREVPQRPDSLPVRLTCPYDKPCSKIKATKRGPEPGECHPSVHVEGVVEVFYNESWQLISAEGWDDKDISVLCGELGYPLGFGTVSDYQAMLDNGTKIKKRHRKAFNIKTSKVLMKKVECTGAERQLRLCHHYGWGPFDNPGGKVATARCGFKAHPSCGNNSQQPAYRLRSGVLPWQGRIEVLYSNIWGTICDIGFNYDAANVLCRSLGYGTSRTITTRAGYGRGIGEVWMSELRCDGIEDWLHDCKRRPWGQTPRCGEHAGDVGVECAVPDIYADEPELVRYIPVADSRNHALVNTFVEVAGEGSEFGLMCYDDVDMKTLEVLCRSSSPSQYFLAHRYNTHTLYKGRRYKGTFICNGSELSIRECRLAFNHVAKCDKGDLVIFCDRGRPDLVPVLDRFRSSLASYPYTDLIPMYYLRCAMEDECLASDAANKSNSHLRSLLRFDSLTMNYGIREFSPFLERSQWIWHVCHNHYHSFEVFVAYDLLDLNGRKIAEGHKASFCLEDSFCDTGGYAQRRCGSGVQGISVNCGDLYARHLDCQWIDITGVPDGSYILLLHVNPDRLVVESDYGNNIIQCIVRLIGRRVIVNACTQFDH